MKLQWKSFVTLVAVCLAMAAPASAVPIVITGTSYSIYLAGEQSGNAAAGFFIFDGGTEFIERPGDGTRVFASETETELDATRSQITITLWSGFPLFPVPDEVAILGIGTFNDPLNLSRPVRLEEVRISFTGTKETITTGNLLSEVSQPRPWNGFFPNASTVLGIGGIGMGVHTIAFEFIVDSAPSAVPEPGIVLLSGAGLLALLAVRRRKAPAIRA